MRYENEIVGKDADKVKPPEEPPEESDSKFSPGKNALILLRDIMIAFAVIVVILQFVKPTIVFEHSMEDTLHPEDYVFLAKQAYLFNDIKFGDIVVCESALLDERGVPKNLIKRVIGLPGDIIAIKDNAVYRNGERLTEPYTKDGITHGEMAPVTVPQDAYFLLGDNREISKDSRNAEVGFVTRDEVKGKVFFRLFPISTAGSIK